MKLSTKKSRQLEYKKVFLVQCSVTIARNRGQNVKKYAFLKEMVSNTVKSHDGPLSGEGVHAPCSFHNFPLYSPPPFNFLPIAPFSLFILPLFHFPVLPAPFFIFPIAPGFFYSMLLF